MPVSFLAFPAWQVWTLAAITAAVITGLFFLKMRHPRVVVGSLILWRRVLTEYRPDSLWERLRRLISLLLALTIALLIALSLGDPVPSQATTVSGRVLLVMDTSYSMASRTRDGRRRWDHAIDRAREQLAAATTATQFALFDTSARTAEPMTRSRTDVRAALDRMAPVPQAGAFPTLPSETDRVIFITDGVSRFSSPAAATVISVFEASDNLAMTAFEVRPVPAQPQRLQAYLEAANFSTTARPVSIRIESGATRVAERTATLEPGASFREVLELPKGFGGELRATVAPLDDALPEDNVAYGYAFEHPQIRVGLVSESRSALATALAADPRVVLTPVDSTGIAAAAERVDVFVFEHGAPTQAPPKPSLIVAPTAVPAWLGSSGSGLQDVVVTSSLKGHPVLQFVPLADVRIAQLQVVRALNATALVRAGDAPLMSVVESPTRLLISAIDLAGPDFSHQLGFPILVENALSWLTERSAPLRATPGMVTVPWPDATVSAPGGATLPTRRGLGHTMFDAAAPGLYKVKTGEVVHPVLVNVAGLPASKVNDSDLQAAPEAAPSVVSRMPGEWWMYMVGAALCLATLEWWTYHRRITV